MSTKDVAIQQDIHAENDRIADGIRSSLAQKGIYAIDVMGAPGAGKTSCLIRIIERLGDIKVYVIEGDIQSDIDTEKLRKLGIEAVQIHTGGACHIDGILIQNTLPQLSLAQSGVLFIENIGNLVCPAEFYIGENCKMLIVTAADGADKPYKYPLAFEKASVILVNKSDLLSYVDFDTPYFLRGVRALNPDVPIFFVSAREGDGFDGVCAWIKANLS